MSTFEEPLSAGVEKRLPGGRQFLLLSTTAPVDVVFYGPNWQPLEKWEGIQAFFKNEFNKEFLGVGLTSASAQTVKCAVTAGDAELQTSAGTVDANPISGSVAAAATDVSCSATGTTQLAAADTDRKELHINNLSSTVTLRIGDSGAGASKGIPLYPTQTYVFTTTAALYAYNPSGGAVSVAVLAINE